MRLDLKSMLSWKSASESSGLSGLILSSFMTGLLILQCVATYWKDTVKPRYSRFLKRIRG